MELSPQTVRNAQFKSARKGLDPDEVKTFLSSVADELERAQNQSTAMEARARAAVARMQELTESTPAPPPPGEVPVVSTDEAETISRTLLLAQRTADQALADAKQESDKVMAAANLEASRTLESSQETSARLLEEARNEAREVGKEERISLDAEVNALMARRDFLESDVEHLEQFLVAQRGRLRDAAASLVELTERVPGGLGEVRRPLLSASDDAKPDLEEDTDPYGVPAQNDQPDSVADDTSLEAPELGGDDPSFDAPDADDGSDHVGENVTTELADLVAETDDDESPGSVTDPTPVGDDGFRLRFDDQS